MADRKALTTESYYETEQPLHRKYLLEFRVQLCSCAAEDCLNAHSTSQQRRIPMLTSTGQWNYQPQKCKQVLCRKTDCCLAHNDDEVKYHPAVYKTKTCAHPVDSKGICTGFGPHCPFAHSELDLRKTQLVDERPKRELPRSRTLDQTKAQLRSDIERLRALVTCRCSALEKEWLLGCGHMICGLCCTGHLRQCPICGSDVREVRAVSLS